MSKRTTLGVVSNEVYNIARNLFGTEIPAQKELKEKIAIESFVATSNPENNTFVYPAIVDEAVSMTMKNYKKYAALHNFKVSEENIKIHNWNSDVIKFRKDNKESFNEVQKIYPDLFIKNNKNLHPQAYNDLVEEFVKEHGMLLRKKKLLTMKPPLERAFLQFLTLFNQQLMKRNQFLISCRSTAKCALPVFKINCWKAKELTSDGIKTLDLCKKTFLNYRKRLEEFGVFQDYHFAGRQRGVEMQINPEILVVKDLHNSKITIVENQRVTPESEKKVTDINKSLTRTLLNDSEMKGKLEISPDKEFPAVTPFNLSFTRTPDCNSEIQTKGGGENVKISKTLSEKALETIISDAKLADELSKCSFGNYKPIPIPIFEQIAYRGTLLLEEFHDVVTIDFFKCLQKNLYKDKHVYPGTWYNAIKIFRQQRWRLFNGNVMQPHNLLSEITQYRWRIQWARNWIAKNENFNILYPCDYLDVTRTDSKTGGFEYTKAKWLKQLADNKKYDEKIKRQIFEAKNRDEKINYTKKMETQLNRFFKNKITIVSLFEYAQKNLPKETADQLPALIEKRQNKINEKIISQDIQDEFKVRYSAFDF